MVLEFFAGQLFNEFCVAAHWASAGVMTAAAATPDFIGTQGKIKLFIPNVTVWGVPPDYVEWANPSIFSFLAAFAFITGGFHLYYAMTINTHDSTVRFLEYSITATIMALCIAILTGITDVYTLIGIAGLISTTMVFGAYEEWTTGNTSRIPYFLRPFWVGFLPYIVAWIPITWHFIRAVTTLDVPEFVIAVYALEVILFTFFAYVQWKYVVKPGQVTDKVKMEGFYNLLSITSKMLLIWLTFGGLAARDE